MKLYGLVESLKVEMLFERLDPIAVPHPMLFAHLANVHPEHSIGLAIDAPRKKTTIESVQFLNHDIYLDLHKRFKKQGNSIVFLESTAFYTDIAKRTKQLQALEKEIKHASEDTFLEKYRAQDKLGIELAYEAALGRERPILENIAREKPDIVFIGLGHAGRFYRDQARLKEQYSIVIDEYWEDRVVRQPSEDDIVMAMDISEGHIPLESILQDQIEVDMRKITSPDEAYSDKECPLIERKYRAAKHGRVTEGTPDYIGTWDLRLEHRGLFELFVQERTLSGKKTNIKGLIEDCNGTAGFEGFTNDNYIEFTKVYANDAPWHAAKGNIFYNAYDPGTGEYRGEYLGMDCGRGKFTMKKFSPPAHPTP
jgi:hypothetical protein